MDGLRLAICGNHRNGARQNGVPRDRQELVLISTRNSGARLCQLQSKAELRCYPPSGTPQDKFCFSASFLSLFAPHVV